MATVDRGTRVVLRAAHRTVPLRTLAPVTLEGSWSVPVMTEALRGAVRGMLEVQTPMGLMSSEAEVVGTEAGMVLRAVRDAGVQQVQRRSHVRVAVDLALRAAALAGGRAGCPEEFGGRTVSIGGGGVSIAWDHPVPLTLGARVFLELQLPDAGLIPAVVRVVAGDDHRVRVAFVDVAPIDVERLVALVFRVQREQLAERRRGRMPTR
ncbi:MAG: PilZ domain-containing protein [Kineosporiaceae bacterium]